MIERLFLFRTSQLRKGMIKIFVTNWFIPKKNQPNSKTKKF